MEWENTKTRLGPQQRKSLITSGKQVRHFEIDKRRLSGYEEKFKIELLLPVNDEGNCKKFVPWKTKSVFTSNDPSKSNEKCHYHLHPELILNSTDDEPVAVICTNRVESIT